jgi:hypothetical protein
MASIQHARAHQAWKSMLIHTRTELMNYQEAMVTDGCSLWFEFTCLDEHSLGAIELYNPAWVMKNFAWGQWLARCRWAILNEERAQEGLVAFRKMCAAYRMMFKDPEIFESAVFWNKINDVNGFLGCYLHGWKSALPVISFESWMSSHAQSWTNVRLLRERLRLTRASSASSGTAWVERQHTVATDVSSMQAVPDNGAAEHATRTRNDTTTISQQCRSAEQQVETK